MTQSAFSGHCERFEKSRGNLKTSLLDFGNRPFRGNDKYCFRNRNYLRRLAVAHAAAAYAFDPMNGLYINSVGELMAAAETARHNRRTGLAVPNSRKEAVLTNLHG